MFSHDSGAGDDGDPEHYPQYILLPQKNPFITLNVSLTDVLRFESKNDNICSIHYIHPDTGRYKDEDYACPFGRIEERLCRHPLFFRVHNQHIINYSQVLQQDIKAMSIEMKNHDLIPLSHRRKKKYLDHISRFCIILNDG